MKRIMGFSMSRGYIYSVEVWEAESKYYMLIGNSGQSMTIRFNDLLQTLMIVQYLKENYALTKELPLWMILSEASKDKRLEVSRAVKSGNRIRNEWLLKSTWGDAWEKFKSKL